MPDESPFVAKTLSDAVSGNSGKLLALLETLVSTLALEEAGAAADRLGKAMETVARREVQDALQALPRPLTPEEVLALLESKLSELLVRQTASPAFTSRVAAIAREQAPRPAEAPAADVGAILEDLLRSDALKERIRAVAREAVEASLEEAMGRILERARQVTTQEVGQGLEGAWMTPEWRRSVEAIVRATVDPDRLVQDVARRVGAPSPAEGAEAPAVPALSAEEIYDGVAERLKPMVERVVRQALRDASRPALPPEFETSAPLLRDLAARLGDARRRRVR